MPKTCGKSIDDEKIWKYFRAPSRVLQKVQDRILHDAYMLLKHDAYKQKYSRLRCLLHVKGLVICFYLG